MDEDREGSGLDRRRSDGRMIRVEFTRAPPLSARRAVAVVMLTPDEGWRRDQAQAGQLELQAAPVIHRTTLNAG
jgi:hypothetical protein